MDLLTRAELPHSSRTSAPIEGPAVAPLGFGPYGGQLLVADEDFGQIHAISRDGIVTYDVFDWYGAESVQVIPSAPCSFYTGGGTFFQAIQNFNAIYKYPLTDFTGLGGNILVLSEYARARLS